MRNFLIIVMGVLLLNAVLLYSGGFDYIKSTFEPIIAEPGISPDVVDTFRETLEAEVRDNIGMPIEGYEPAMFLSVFPGLATSDFDGVEASIGRYVLREGELEHELDQTQLVHSAAGAITRQGVETLYRNVAKRMDIDIHAGGTLADIMRVLVGE